MSASPSPSPCTRGDKYLQARYGRSAVSVKKLYIGVILRGGPGSTRILMCEMGHLYIPYKLVGKVVRFPTSWEYEYTGALDGGKCYCINWQYTTPR